MSRIYVASSWRNVVQPGVVVALRRCGHEVYDFRNPAPGANGFSWSEIDPDWQAWTAEQYRDALKHPVAKRGYTFDIEALNACDACVLVLPSGRSASWELGYAMGQGKAGYVLQIDKVEPELMYREATLLTSFDELLDAFGFDAARARSQKPSDGAREPTAEKLSILRRPAVQKLVQLSCSSIYRMMKAGEFPSAIRLSKNAVGWRYADIKQWLDQRESVDSLGGVAP